LTAADALPRTIEAPARTDLFCDPAGGEPILDAPRSLVRVDGDVLFVARVTVAFAETFDAGVLLAWADERNWAKLCFERAPDGTPTVVSVVTHDGVSDDANAFTVDGDSVWLRIARISPAFAFHASLDGDRWTFVRHFALTAPELGLLAQSPMGDGCTAQFDGVRIEARTLDDLRDGS
jgi:uncharacterized protein